VQQHVIAQHQNRSSGAEGVRSSPQPSSPEESPDQRTTRHDQRSTRYAQQQLGEERLPPRREESSSFPSPLQLPSQQGFAAAAAAMAAAANLQMPPLGLPHQKMAPPKPSVVTIPTGTQSQEQQAASADANQVSSSNGGSHVPLLQLILSLVDKFLSLTPASTPFSEPLRVVLQLFQIVAQLEIQKWTSSSSPQPQPQPQTNADASRMILNQLQALSALPSTTNLQQGSMSSSGREDSSRSAIATLQHMFSNPSSQLSGGAVQQQPMTPSLSLQQAFAFSGNANAQQQGFPAQQMRHQQQPEPNYRTLPNQMDFTQQLMGLLQQQPFQPQQQQPQQQQQQERRPSNPIQMPQNSAAPSDTINFAQQLMTLLQQQQQGVPGQQDDMQQQRDHSQNSNRRR